MEWVMLKDGYIKINHSTNIYIHGKFAEPALKYSSV